MEDLRSDFSNCVTNKLENAGLSTTVSLDASTLTIDTRAPITLSSLFNSSGRTEIEVTAGMNGHLMDAKVTTDKAHYFSANEHKESTTAQAGSGKWMSSGEISSPDAKSQHNQALKIVQACAARTQKAYM